MGLYQPIWKTFFGLALFHLGWGLPQTFRVAPHSVEVVAGSSVTLFCEIDNQQGKAQWTKDGFALGFNRSSIPGFPRYSVLGDEAAGVHNLRITEVVMLDDGEYQCQVTPYGIAGAIRHAANLTVLLPPTSIEMAGHVQDAKITVRAGDSISLECLIKDSKPVAQVTWYRGSEVLRLESQEDTREDSETNAHLASLRTKITFTPTHSDNGMEYSCHALHPALQHSNTQKVARVHLDVHYEPGAPEITGYTEGEIVRAGDRKTLTCRARGGNPLPEVFWYKNGAQVDKNFIKHRSYAINEYSFQVEASDNLARYECHVLNVMTTEPKKAEIQLRVNFAASSVTISGPDEAKVGDVIAISCVAENSNPPADVTVVINGQTPPGATSRTQKVDHGGWRTITNLTNYEVRPIDSDLTVNCYALNQALGSTKIDTKVVSVLRPPEAPVILGYEPGRLLKKGNPQRLTCVSNGGNPLATLRWYKATQPLSAETRHDSGAAISELDVVLTESDNEAEYRCEATNSATSEPLVNSTILSVMFPPSGVKVSARPRAIVANTQASLVCESASSNPPANVTWWRDGFEVQPGDSQVNAGQFGGTTTKYTVKVDVTADDDGAVFTCQADNRFGTTTHDAVTLSVQYPPVWVIMPSKKVGVNEGENVLVNVSARGNPVGVTYLWRRGEEVVMAGSLLNITGVAKDQAGVYTVEASNSQGVTTANLTLDIKYGAIITSISGGRNLSVGESVTLVCRVDARPDPDISWGRQGYNFARTEHKKHLSENVVEMTIKNVTTEDTGIFTCRAKNEVGEEATANTTIVVKHKPIIDKSAKYQKAAAEAGRSARLTCRASGAPYVHFTWYTRDNTPIEPAIYARFDNRYIVEDTKLVDELVTYESVLLVKNITNKDYGFFECQAQNPLGSSRSAIHLDGTSKPDTPLDLKVVNFTHNSVDVQWTPSFDGGLPQKFRVRFHITDTNRYQYTDVYPENATSFTVTGLALGTGYSFGVLAYNDKGVSEYTKADVQAVTSSTAPATDTPPTVAPGARVSGLIVVIITLVGAALLVLNVALVACFVKRRARKRLTACSDKGSSKSTTIEMYAPSSYTGTVTGETLSSISEKSRESYAHEDSGDEYATEAARVTAASTYLIEQLEPPPQYATRPPPHILPPPPSHNDLNMDDPYDDVRRNQYNAALDRAAAGYGTLGRRNTTPDHYNINTTPDHYNINTTPDHYNITAADDHYPLPNRYNTYQPPPAHTPLTAHTQNNGSLRRNQPSKLHFPKDYIRNGSMNIPVSSSSSSSSAGIGSQYSNKPQSPTRAHPPTHTPMLSTFAPDASPPSGMPLEHRGHLV
ncbi:nephrin isoform X2 [Procambarus clarkii]|uniref:nephrin isoform X2 n=1 Tax=Procambarus clarkii TaxID=6728 RepID=UPI003744419A